MSAKYYKRGQREYYQVTPERVIRIVNKLVSSEITIAHTVDTYHGTFDFISSDALEGTEITREEFAEQFKIAAKLIVLDP